MNRTLSTIFSALICFNIGCANEPAAPANGVALASAPQQEQANEAEAAKGIGEKIGSIVEQVTANAPSMDDVKGVFKNVGDATDKTTDDAMAWATKMYESLKKSGETTTGNVSDWISEDWNNINAWEYQVVTIDIKQVTENPSVLQEKLNEVGKQRWECFHVSENAAGTTFFVKRQKKSYMKSLPLKDMLKLVPLLDNE